MNRIMARSLLYLTLLVLLLCLCRQSTQAQTTAFTYQGKLNDNGIAANGGYDLQFRLFDALVGGSQVGATLVREDVTVTSGIFSVTLDFGAAAFPGAERFLEIAVRPGVSTGAFTALSPLQPITPTPYAIRSLNATMADGLSVACINCVTSSQINSINGSQISGAIPPASVPDLGASYLKNGTTTQANSNFNISGNGVVSGNLSAGTLSGNGSGVTNLNATNIASGTLNNARLGIVPIVNGGTGITSSPSAAGQYLRSSGASIWAVGGIQAGDLPSLPYVAKSGDTMTGTLNLPANGLVAGSNQLVLAGGNVGIGTTSPAFGLHVGNNKSARFELGVGKTLSLGGVGTFEVDAVNIVGGRFIVKDNGRVGIGISTPEYKLHVVDGVDGGFIGGVEGVSTTGGGVVGISTFGDGVLGTSSSHFGVSGFSVSSDGVRGESSGGIGVHGISSSGFAGYFEGKVHVAGMLEKGGGGFKIDHPLDPEHKYLNHSFVESPDMKNIYDGVAVLDANGTAVVEFPDWFGALNKDFRYQLTAIGAPGPNLYIAEEVANNHFKIAGGQAGMKVSWQVTGIRQDRFANANRLKVEEDKPATEAGYYLHPQLHGQPEEKGIEWAHHPELMRQMKEQREKAQLLPEKAGSNTSQTSAAPIK